MPKSQVDSIDRALGARIEMWREERKIGRPKLAKRIGGVSAMQLFKYERGLTRITASAAIKIARAFERPIAELLDGIGAPKRRRVLQGKLKNGAARRSA